jgi:putative transposase
LLPLAALLSEELFVAGLARVVVHNLPQHVTKRGNGTQIALFTDADYRLYRDMLALLHRRYAGAIHAGQKRIGPFWQGSFGCVPMDEPNLATALRHAVLNPVRARLVKQAQDWSWACNRALLGIEENPLTSVACGRTLWPDLEVKSLIKVSLTRCAWRKAWDGPLAIRYS